MKTLLVPIDGSDSSIRALKAAIELAKQVGNVSLFVITVQPPIISGNVKRFFTSDAIQAFYEEEGRTALAPALAVLKEADVPFTEQVLVGPVAMTIAEFAETHDCDQIFMGTRGLGLVTGLVMGSVTTKVISLSKIPVTLIK